MLHFPLHSFPLSGARSPPRKRRRRAYGGRFKQWLNRFNGVATKYLPSYLGWRRWLEKGEEIITPQTALAAALG